MQGSDLIFSLLACTTPFILSVVLASEIFLQALMGSSTMVNTGVECGARCRGGSRCATSHFAGSLQPSSIRPVPEPTQL